MRRKNQWYVLAVAAVLVMAGGLMAKRYAANVARDRVNAALVPLTKYATIDYDDVSVDLLGLDPHVWNLSITPLGTQTTVRIADVALYDVDRQHQFPATAHIALTGISLNPSELAAWDSTGTAAKLGNRPLQGALELAYAYTADRNELSIDRLGIAIDSLFDTRIAVRLGNLPVLPQGLLPTDGEPMGGQALLAMAMLASSLGDVWVASAEAQYRDLGLLPKLVVDNALADASTVADAQARLARQLQRWLATNAAAIGADDAKAIAVLIERPQDIQFSIAPKIPLPLARFVTASAAGSSLGDLRLRITTTPATQTLADRANATIPAVVAGLVADAQNATQQGAPLKAAMAIERAAALTPNDPGVAAAREALKQKIGFDFDMHHVDFKNFTYRSTGCARAYHEDGLPTSIPVRDGTFRVGPEEGYVEFTVGDVLYRDLNGDGLSEAVVRGQCIAYGANSGATELFVYTTGKGEPQLLGTISDDDVDGDYKRTYGGFLWGVKEAALHDGALDVIAYGDGSHAQPDHQVTLRYRWDGQHLTLAERPLVEVAKFD